LGLGKLEKEEGEKALPPVRRLEICGSPTQRGRRHGQTLAGEIREMRRGLITYLAWVSLYLGALPLFGLFLLLAWRLWPYIPARLRQEMRGLAAGAQVGLGAVLLINVLDDLAHNLPYCSALAVGEGLSARGSYLMGRNLDYPLFIDFLVRLQTLFLMEPDQGQPLASLAWPGYVGVCTGSNRAGVALAQLAAMTTDRTLKGVPAALRFRLALEEGETLARVASRILTTPGTIGNNLMLASPKEAAVLELSARFGVVRHPQGGLLTATNHYQSAAMQHLKGPYPQRLPFSPLSPYHFTEAYSQARDVRLQQLARGGSLGPGEIQAVLADAHIANPGTAVCTIFAPAEGTVWVSRAGAAPVSQGPFEEIKLWT
jgi:hypothetical protein